MPSLQISGKTPITRTGAGDVTVVAAPDAPRFVRVHTLFLTVSATSTVDLKSGSDVVGGGFLGTGNNMALNDPKNGVIDCEPGKAFVITNSAGNLYGFCVYEVVGGG